MLNIGGLGNIARNLLLKQQLLQTQPQTAQAQPIGLPGVVQKPPNLIGLPRMINKPVAPLAPEPAPMDKRNALMSPNYLRAMLLRQRGGY